MYKSRSVYKEWDFVLKGTELPVGRFLVRYFTPLTLREQHQGALSDEDVTEVWMTAKSEVISKVGKLKVGSRGPEVPNPDEKELEKTFWISRSNGLVINRKMKWIIILEFKRASDTTETYYSEVDYHP